MTPKQKQRLEAAILADLHDQSKTYVMIALSNKVGTNRVQDLAKAHGLNRRRGMKPGTRVAARFEQE